MLPPPPRPKGVNSTLTDDDIQSFLEPGSFGLSLQYGSMGDLASRDEQGGEQAGAPGVSRNSSGGLEPGVSRNNSGELPEVPANRTTTPTSQQSSTSKADTPKGSLEGSPALAPVHVKPPLPEDKQPEEAK